MENIENSSYIDFTPVPEFLHLTNQSLTYINTSPVVESKIILHPNKTKYKLKNKFCIKLDIPSVVDWVTINIT